MRRACVWIGVTAFVSMAVLGRVRAQSGTPVPIEAGHTLLAEGPDWVAPEAGGVEAPQQAPPLTAPPAQEVPPLDAPPADQSAAATSAPPEQAGPPIVAPQPADPEPQGQDPVFKEWGAPGALPPRELGPPIQAALMLGVGATFNDTAGSINPLGFGFGIRGSYRLNRDFVLGGRFLYYVGGDSRLPTGEISMSSWQLAVEAAYVVPITDTIELEPGILVGFNVLSLSGTDRPFLEDDQSIAVPGTAESAKAALYFAPGAAIRFPIAMPGVDDFFVGADLRLGFQFRDVVGTSLELLGQVGIRF